ncbi:hypothetical protein Ahu01nite_079600 [Winogradskya humida]|uniref:Uncharacterized protein n=1 Tax=Winogradskya humida TaxID=113566 RepID=A0ABQ4A1Y8_9ACTN|nr:hypothetical protein Ahu01nite_079600 [Actinoplanes humidus]
MRVVTCCRGWYFEHSAECCTPYTVGPCSDCYADPGSCHIYPCCSWFDVEPVESPAEASLWPDAARWPGHPLASSPPFVANDRPVRLRRSPLAGAPSQARHCNPIHPGAPRRR